MDLTEARLDVGDWRWQYSKVRPHRSLAHISPVRFAQRLNPSEDEQGSGGTGSAASFRQNLDSLYNFNHVIMTLTPTNDVALLG